MSRVRPERKPREYKGLRAAEADPSAPFRRAAQEALLASEMPPDLAQVFAPQHR
jgi:hypothetical protein